MSRFQNILALDSALGGCCVGVFSKGRRFARAEAMSSGQAERLMPLIQDVMKEAGLEFSGLDAIVTTVGPGAFTGLRIGLSAAKSLGLALGKPVFGVTTLQALASQYAYEKKPGNSVAVILETKRDDFYFQIFSKEAIAKSEAEAVPGDFILNALKKEKFAVLGDGMRLGVHFEGGYTLPDAGFMAFDFHEKQGEGYAEGPVPVYLRGADVTSPKKPGRPAFARN